MELCGIISALGYPKPEPCIIGLNCDDNTDLIPQVDASDMDVIRFINAN